jgi:dihydroneopterin aldolase
MYFLDLEIGLNAGQAMHSDDINGTVDFEELYRLIEKNFREPVSKLIEHVAYRLLTHLFAQFTSIEEITIRIRKPQVPLDGILDAAEFEVTRQRQDMPVE